MVDERVPWPGHRARGHLLQPARRRPARRARPAHEAGAHELSGRLRAGGGRATITPPVGIAHAGGGAQTHERAEGIEGDFFVTALALADDDLTCLVVELDTGLL